jgi:hypothetical protein
LTNLDLGLFHANATDWSQNLWTSHSGLYNIEHIFHKLPADDTYEFWVRQTGAGAGFTYYAVAWWATCGPNPGGGPGLMSPG